MDSKQLANTINELLIPLAFKRKRNKWIKLTNDLSATVYLQKSQYGNIYYLRYFFTILSIDPEGKRSHAFSGLGSTDDYHSKRIKELLDLDTAIDDHTRSSELQQYIKDIVIPKISTVNTVHELYHDFIIKHSYQNMVTGDAIEYFKSLGLGW